MNIIEFDSARSDYSKSRIVESIFPSTSSFEEAPPQEQADSEKPTSSLAALGLVDVP